MEGISHLFLPVFLQLPTEERIAHSPYLSIRDGVGAETVSFCPEMTHTNNPGAQPAFM